jgi:hypothetical protein
MTLGPEAMNEHDRRTAAARPDATWRRQRTRPGQPAQLEVRTQGAPVEVGRSRDRVRAETRGAREH